MSDYAELKKAVWGKHNKGRKLDWLGVIFRVTSVANALR